MRHLFLARHGSYNYDGNLNRYGREQMHALGRSIKEVVGDANIMIVSSPAPRAKESSRILMEELSIAGFEEIPYLWCGRGAPQESYGWKPDNKRVMKIVHEREESIEGLVVVSHLELLENFFTHFIIARLNEVKQFGEVDPGTAAHVYLIRRTYQLLPK